MTITSILIVTIEEEAEVFQFNTWEITIMKLLINLLITALAVSIGVSTPMRYVSTMASSSTKYISEVKVGMDKTEQGAVKELLDEGFTILSKDGKYADLNEDAGSKDTTMGRGQKKVYLGYKTTTNPNEAITDLAVMNMRGGYSVRDYEQLMETRLKSQIIPFVERFVTTIQEYRDNLNSPFASNKARAEYMKSMLNKLKDDDTGALIGNLLVNETKFELGDSAYNALSEEEKKEHADIVTIAMQANGKSTLAMETLLTKASDSAETSWIDRLENNTLEDLRNKLIDQGTDITEIDATLDRLYEDSANQLLEKWDAFNHALLDYDEKANELANIDEHEYDEQVEAIDQFDDSKEFSEKNGEAVVASLELQDEFLEATNDLELVAAHDRLEEVDYDFEDGSTLADFFMQDASVFSGDNIRNLYPIVASLSAGQIAGLDFLSIQDLVTIATADATSYENEDLGNIEPASIYESVNREIFEKGKVALTNKALRAEAMKNDTVADHPLSVNTYILWGATAIATAGMIASWTLFSQFKTMASTSKTAALTASKIYKNTVAALSADHLKASFQFKEAMGNTMGYSADRMLAKDLYKSRLSSLFGKKSATQILDGNTTINKVASNAASKSKICAYLGTAFTVAMVALSIYSIISTVQELMAYYKVEYSPIPKYIVEETAITETVDGVTTVKRNDSAYYRVVECNRKPDADFYEQLQNYADLNGDVGKEWLALYFAKQVDQAPIKADSLKVVTGTSSIPNGYSNLGIHNFETKNAYNLTSPYYCYNDTPKGTYVYYQVDESILKNASLAGSNFSTGSAVLFSGIGAVVGAGIALAIMLILNKRKENKIVQE